MMSEILLGAGELYMYSFNGTALPADGEIETDDHNVGHCSGGFTVSYKPTRYQVKNQYGSVVRSFVTQETVTAKTGILTWDLDKLAMLSTARVVEGGNVRTLIFGGGSCLDTVLLRFVHTKADGKKLRFTMVGQGGAGFSFEFGDREVSIDSELTAIQQLPGMLASFTEEV